MNKYGESSASSTDTTVATTSNLVTTSNTTTPVPFPREWWEDSWIMNVPGYQRGSLQEMYLASISFSLATITGGNIDIVPVCVDSCICMLHRSVCVSVCMYLSMYVCMHA